MIFQPFPRLENITAVRRRVGLFPLKKWMFFFLRVDFFLKRGAMHLQGKIFVFREDSTCVFFSAQVVREDSTCSGTGLAWCCWFGLGQVEGILGLRDLAVFNWEQWNQKRAVVVVLGDFVGDEMITPQLGGDYFHKPWSKDHVLKQPVFHMESIRGFELAWLNSFEVRGVLILKKKGVNAMPLRGLINGGDPKHFTSSGITYKSWDDPPSV